MEVWEANFHGGDRMTAPIVSTYSRAVLDLSDPVMLEIMEADCLARRFMVRPQGSLWERVAEGRS